MKERFQISVESTEQGNGQVEIFDLLGRQMMQKDVWVQKGDNLYEMNLDNLFASGRYNAHLTVNNQVAQIPIVKTE